jgi:hypothetical protein
MVRATVMGWAMAKVSAMVSAMVRPNGKELVSGSETDLDRA